MMENHSRLIIGLLKLHHVINWVIITTFFLFAPYDVAAQIGTLPPPSQAGYPLDPSIKVSPSMAIILVCLLTVFLLLGCFSVYIRHIIELRLLGNFPYGGGRRQREAAGGIDPVLIDTFPTFKYSEVRGLKIGSVALECAVCLNEFEDDDDTLRLLPKCSHVFHSHCIDAWLVSHITCPVCRANLVPEPGKLGPTKTLSHDSDHEPVFADHSSGVVRVADDLIIDVQSPDAINPNQTQNQNRPSRSPSGQTGEKFLRSNSTGHLPDLNFERFTLKLPEEVRNRIVNSSLSRTKSWVEFPRARSSRKGLRTTSVGTGRGRNYFYYERFDRNGQSDRSAFTMTPSYFYRSGSAKGLFNSVKSPFDRLLGGRDKDNNGERSFNGLKHDGQV